MWEKALLPADADRTQRLLRQNGHFSFNKGLSPLSSVWSNPSSRGMWFADYRHTLSPLQKWGWFSLLLRSHTSCWQFAPVKSKPHWVVATLQTSKSSRSRRCPQPPVDWRFLDLSNNNWDKAANEVCHTHITSQAWFLQCWTNRKRGPFSN